jgi:hypothetical protein
MTLDRNGNLSVSGIVKIGATLSTENRMHISGGEYLYLLHKNGVIIGKEWGGNGNLTVQGSFSITNTNNNNTFTISLERDKVVFYLSNAYHGTNKRISWDGDNNWDQVS